MSTKKETPTNTAMLAGARQEAATWQASTPCPHNTTDRPVGQAVKVSDFLQRGRENATPLKRLKQLFHRNGRAIRLMIRAERLGGVPILADNMSGYYLPGSDYELAQCVRSLRHRANEIIRAANAIEGATDIGE